MFHSIPLVARRPKSGEPGIGKGKDKKADKKKDKSADPDKPDTPVPPSDPDEKVRKDNCTVERGQTAKLKKQLTKPQLKENYSQVFIFPNKLRGNDLRWTSILSKGE